MQQGHKATTGLISSWESFSGDQTHSKTHEQTHASLCFNASDSKVMRYFREMELTPKVATTTKSWFLHDSSEYS